MGQWFRGGLVFEAHRLLYRGVRVGGVGAGEGAARTLGALSPRGGPVQDPVLTEGASRGGGEERGVPRGGDGVGLPGGIVSLSLRLKDLLGPGTRVKKKMVLACRVGGW